MKEIYNLSKCSKRFDIYYSTSKHVQSCVENSAELSTRRSVMFDVYSQTSQRFSQNFIRSLIFFEIRERLDNE